MLARLRKSQEENESGFTLIELLVVIIIIGILAAIAIPTFLNQRKKGWDASMKSALKNAATAQESFFTENSAYGSLGEITTEGFNASENVTVVVSSGDGIQTFCMTATHSSYSGRTWKITDDSGAPSVGTC